MRLTGTDRLDLPSAEAWSRLSDLQVLAAALPSVEDVETAGEDSLEATFRPRTTLGTTPLRMTFEVVERRSPEWLLVRGSGGASEYTLNVEASFELSAAGEQTEVAWDLDLHLRGVLRSLTQRVFAELAAEQVAAVLAGVQPTGAAPG